MALTIAAVFMLTSPAKAQTSPGNCLDFDGTNEYVEVPYSAGLNPGIFTVECWAKVEGGAGTFRSPVTSRDAAPFSGYLFYAGMTDNWEFWIGNGTWQPLIGSPVVLDEWFHLAGTFNGTEMKFYIDGVLSGTQTVGGYVPNDSSPLRIGAGVTESSPLCFFDGQVDEVRVWNDVRTSAEIRANMNRALIGNEAGLVAYYQFDESSGTSLPDLAGSNNGTLNNMEDSDWQESSAFMAPPGNCLDFDGADEYVGVTNPPVPVANGSYTIEAWINADLMGARGIVGWGNYSIANQVNALRLTGDGIVNYWWLNDLTITTGDITGGWHHIAATFDGTTRRIFLDGVLMGSDTPTGHAVPDSSNFRIGLTGSGEYFDGHVDEIRIWDISRSGTEIRDNMNQTLTGNETGLAAYYQFDKTSGITLPDLIGINSGTLTNMNDSNWQESYALVRPIAQEASNVGTSSFAARWSPPTLGATPTAYYLDVATDYNFTSFVAGYNNLNVGTVNKYPVSTLAKGTGYFYRVRAYHSGITGHSQSSKTISTTTINSHLSIASNSMVLTNPSRYLTIPVSDLEQAHSPLRHGSKTKTRILHPGNELSTNEQVAVGIRLASTVLNCSSSWQGVPVVLADLQFKETTGGITSLQPETLPAI